MAHRSSFSDRMLKRAVPTPVAGATPPPREIAPGLWVLDRTLRHFGVALLPTRTTLVRTRPGGLAVISPPPLVDARGAEAIASLGRVEHVVLPNTFHYLYANEFASWFPDAAIVAAPGLRQRVPGLAIDSELGASPPPETWAGVLETVVVGPVAGACEVLFFHAPTATLVLTDLAFHVRRFPRAFDRVFWRLAGIPGGFGPGRTTRTLLLRDRAVAARALSAALEWPIERIVVAHGEIVEGDARGRLAEAFRGWLGPRSAA